MARLVVLLGVALAGCASVRPAPARETASLAREGRARGLPLRDPLELDEGTAYAVVQRVGLRDPPEERAHRLVRYLRDLHGFSYAADESRTAAEAFAARRGDCFAATNLFVALARALGVDARFVYVREVGRYQERDGSFVVSSHVAARVGDGPRPEVVDFERPADAHTLADYRDLPDREAAALFNSNLAVQHLLRGRSHTAAAMLAFLVERAPELPELRANLGVALRRSGRPGAAAEALEEALARFPDFAPLYTNAVAAALARGDDAAARALEARGRGVAEGDPLFVFGQGLRRYGLREYRGAAERFERAAALQADSPTAWAWLARARLAAGQPEAGRAAFARARSLAPRDPRLRELLAQHPELAP